LTVEQQLPLSALEGKIRVEILNYRFGFLSELFWRPCQAGGKNQLVGYKFNFPRLRDDDESV
jgi:hypothetical protein